MLKFRQISECFSFFFSISIFEHIIQLAFQLVWTKVTFLYFFLMKFTIRTRHPTGKKLVFFFEKNFQKSMCSRIFKWRLQGHPSGQVLKCGLWYKGHFKIKCERHHMTKSSSTYVFGGYLWFWTNIRKKPFRQFRYRKTVPERKTVPSWYWNWKTVPT